MSKLSIPTRLLLIAIVLLLSAMLRARRSDQAPAVLRKPFSAFPTTLGNWTLLQRQTISPDVLAVLKPDDYIERTYLDNRGQSIELFIAYYRSQRAGEAMHSPKNCLPGGGWLPVQDNRIRLTLTGEPYSAADVNQYVIEKNGERAVVLYWYQTEGRVIASEYYGKFYLVWDGLRTGRHDGALVRVMTPLTSATAPSQLRGAADFAGHALRTLREFLPGFSNGS